MTTIRVAVVSIVLVLAACASDAQTASTPSTEVATNTSPPTTGEHGNRIERPRPTDLRPIDFDALDAGETVLADWTAPCSFLGLWQGPGMRYLSDREIGGLVRGMFPDAWTVFVLNEESSDGDRFILLDVALTKLDDDTIEMRNGSDDSIVARFIRDTTDPAEWEFCG